MQRFFDIFFSFTALFIFLPFLILIIIILKLTGEGEIFYTQQRIGKHGKSFGLLKFATMKKNSSKMGSGFITTKNDSRILPFGRFLRKTNINELPQLVNVLKGDMSIIGMRPTVKQHFDCFSEKGKKELIKFPPGLSGLGSVVFSNEEKIMSNSKESEEYIHNFIIAPYKEKLELWFVDRRSILLYFVLIILTIFSIISPQKKLYKKLPNLPKPSSELEKLL